MNDAGNDHRRSTWFVGYRFTSNENAVKEKLKNRAASLGLIFANNRPNHASILDGQKILSQGGDVTKANTVWIRALGDHPITGKEQ